MGKDGFADDVAVRESDDVRFEDTDRRQAPSFARGKVWLIEVDYALTFDISTCRVS